MISMDEVKEIGKKLDKAYEEECRNRRPYMMAGFLICAIISWIISAFIICGGRTCE